MNEITKRNLLFLFGCIGFRSIIVYIAKTQPNYLVQLGYIALLPALGFIFIYLFKLRETGAEVFGEKIWWNDLRPLHAILWGTFAYMAINNDTENAWKILLIDTLIGLFAFLNQRKYI